MAKQASIKNTISLQWPGKETIVQGAHTKTNASKNTNEFNAETASNIIRELFKPLVLQNWKHFTTKGLTNINTINKKENFILKGDNLFAMHALKAKYAGTIKLIYIDPPYNSKGNTFTYNDNLNHATWLSFMKNRLEVAHTLLKDDGIIFISCDDRENAYLKVLCDEIFGREHFITQLIWRKKAGGANDSEDIAVEHEYIITYRKKNNGIFKIPLHAEALKKYRHEDEKLATHGPYSIKDLNDPSLSDSKGLHYDVVCPDGTVLKANENQWKCNEKKFKERLNDDRIIFKKNKQGIWHCYYKIYLNEEKEQLKRDANGNIIARGRNISSILYDVALNKEGNKDLTKLFEGDYPFIYPKPVELIKTLVLLASKNDDIVLDFFAGSGTTAQAVLEANKQDNGKRQFILIEQMDYVKDVTCKRIENYLKREESPETFVYAEFAEDKNGNYIPLDDIQNKKLNKIDKALNKEFYSL